MSGAHFADTVGPDTVQAILDGRQPASLTLAVLMRPFAVGGDKQQIAIRFDPGASKSD